MESFADFYQAENCCIPAHKQEDDSFGDDAGYSKRRGRSIIWMEVNRIEIHS